jgi:hypothetical protein
LINKAATIERCAREEYDKDASTFATNHPNLHPKNLPLIKKPYQE